MQAIMRTFADLTLLGWIGQILGLIGFAVITASYQFKKEKFLILSGISYLFFAAESALAFAFCNVIVSGMSFVRNLIMLFFLTKRDREMPAYWTAIVVSLIWVGEILLFILQPETGKAWGNYLPPVLVTLYSVAATHKNYYVLKAGALVHEVGFLTFFAVTGDMPLSVLRQAVLVISILVSVARMLVKDIQRKKRGQNENSPT